MPVGVYKVEYQIDGGEILQAIQTKEGQFAFNVPPTYNGYAVVGIWVWDYALNVTYNTYWYWLQGGHIKSVQLVSDGKFRLNMCKDPIRVMPRPYLYKLTDIGVRTKVRPIPHEVIVRKQKDQVNRI